MKAFNRAPLMIGAAIMLPLLIFLAIQVALSARDQRSAVRSEATVRAERIVAGADVLLNRSLGALDAFAAAAEPLRIDDPLSYRRLQALRRVNPGWVTIFVTDRRTGNLVMDLRQPFGQAAGGSGEIPLPARAGRAFVGGVGGNGPGCPCALIHVAVGDGAYLLTAALDPALFRDLLLPAVGQERIAGIVDADGNFVARSIAHDERVGRPATQFVRDAIRRGSEGVYRGKTFEGLVNYTAFSTSSLSGWSAHVAFSRRLVDAPNRWSLIAALGAALASLMLAALMIGFTLRQLATGRRVQERLQEAQKMEALGQITGGIAHDFNNLLTPIIGGLEVVARRAQLEENSRRLLESALSSARRAAKLTSQLLAFSRRQKLEIRPVDLPLLLAELKPLLDQSAGPHVLVETAVAPGVDGIRTDANQLELALLNLLLNARDAMPGGGHVRILVAPEGSSGSEGKMVAIAFSDTGEGMSPEVLRRATEPFFTTKAAGAGTGLGLAQVYGIVHQSGGSLEIASTPGHGTTVTLRFPACPIPSAEGERAGLPPRQAADRNRRIVICDDDDQVRAFVARILDATGHIVETVSAGRAAIELVRDSGVDLLIVDFAMPGLNGAEVIAAVRQFRPQLPILMITGYADTVALDTMGAGITLLRKPFDGGTLLAAVDSLLNAARDQRLEPEEK